MYRKVYLEWNIDEDSLLKDVPIGFEVEFSRNRNFNEITSTLTTFDKIDPSGSYRFQYSLDGGNVWVQYPYGNQGKEFSDPFKMRLEITPSDFGYSLSFSNGILKKISADSKQIIDTTTLEFEDIKDIDQYEDVLYLVGSKTLYKINGKTLDPYDNSLPLLTNNAIGVAADESRGTLWQINQTSVWLRSLYGDILWTSNIPEIDIDFSSSSGSSGSSSSSSSFLNSDSSESSESGGNVSSSSSSSSEYISSESSLGVSPMYATGFDAYPQLQGTYNAIGISYEGINEYYIYRNANHCYLQHDPYGAVRWKLYINQGHRALARDHYYKNSESLNPEDGGSNNYGIHMWWDVNNIPLTGTNGTISDTP